MAQIPMYQPQAQVSTQAPVQGTVNIQSSPQAFGAGVEEANNGLASKISGAGQFISDRALEMQQEDNKNRVFEASNRYAQLLQDKLYNGDPQSVDTDGSPLTGNAIGRPKGLLNRQGGQALGSTEEYDAYTAKQKQDITDDLSSVDEKNAFHQLATQQTLQSRNAVISNESAQRKSYTQTLADTHLTNQINSAPLAVKTPQQLSDYITGAQQTNTLALKGSGLDADTVNLKNQQAAGKVAASVVNSLLDKNPQAAQAMLDGVRAKLIPSDATDIQHSIDGKLFSIKVQDAIGKTSSMILPDGTHDLNAAEQYVQDLKEPQDVKDKILAQVRTELLHQDSNDNRARAAAVNSLMGNILDAKNSGASFQRAQNMLASAFLDPISKQKASDMITSLYSKPDVPADPATVSDFNDRIRRGVPLSAGEVADAFNKRKLPFDKSQHYLDLIQKPDSDVQKEKVKQTISRVGILADEKFPNASQKIQKEQYKAVVTDYATSNPDKSPGEIAKFGDDLFGTSKGMVDRGFFGKLGKSIYNAGAGIIGAEKLPDQVIGDVPTWKQKYAGIHDSHVSLGEMSAQFGADVTKALGNDPSKIDEFINKFNPSQRRDYFKIGQPGNNAVKSLIRLNGKVTPDNILEILRYSNGTGIINKGDQ